MGISTEELTSLVDWENGLVSSRIFIDEEIYQLELERLFGRAWLFLAHDSMIPNPGDFFSTYMGGDPVIVSRQKDNSVKAFLNVCRHRGMKVCRAEEGNTNAFMCTYHGWTYDGSGALVSVPNFEDAYYGELEMAKWGLVQVRVEGYKGLWFGNFDESAPSLLEYLGDMAWYLDAWVDHTKDRIVLLPNMIKWRIRGNWKLAAEQFAGDTYHAASTHPSSLGIMIPQLGGPIPGRQFSSRLGHAHTFMFNEFKRSGERFSSDMLERYANARAIEARERLGVDRAHGPSDGNWTVFPNMSGLPSAANMRIWHPKGPNAFEIWSWTIVDKEAPEEVRFTQQRGSVLTEGAAGIVESDDGENWNLIGEILENGYQSRQMAWHYRMGLGHELREDAAYPGKIGYKFYGEGAQRGFYRRWLDFITSESWPRVDPSEYEINVPIKIRA